MLSFIASPIAKLALVGALVAGGYLYGRMDGGRLADARQAAVVIEAQREAHRLAERLAEANRARQDAEEAARRSRLSAARSAAPTCDAPEGAREMLRALAGSD